MLKKFIMPFVMFGIMAWPVPGQESFAFSAQITQPEMQKHGGYHLAASREFCNGHKMVTGRTGLAIHKSKAEKRARRKWKERVRWLMPWSWGQANWGKARKRSYRCHKKHGTWRCKASAVPCVGWPS